MRGGDELKSAPIGAEPIGGGHGSGVGEQRARRQRIDTQLEATALIDRVNLQSPVWLGATSLVVDHQDPLTIAADVHAVDHPPEVDPGFRFRNFDGVAAETEPGLHLDVSGFVRPAQPGVGFQEGLKVGQDFGFGHVPQQSFAGHAPGLGIAEALRRDDHQALPVAFAPRLARWRQVAALDSFVDEPFQYLVAQRAAVQGADGEDFLGSVQRAEPKNVTQEVPVRAGCPRFQGGRRYR